MFFFMVNVNLLVLIEISIGDLNYDLFFPLFSFYSSPPLIQSYISEFILNVALGFKSPA